MSPLPDAIKHIFFKVMHGKVPIRDFEQWVYTNEQLEALLPEDDYMELLSFNYQQRGAKYLLFHLLSRLVSLGEYETYKLRLLLESARHRNMELPGVLEQLYERYYRGYTFLQSLGLGYGL